MSEWKEFAITDFAEILNQRRVPLSAMQRAKRKGEFPYFGASGIIDYVDDYLFEGEHVLISEDGENLKSRQTPIAFKADGKFWVNNHAHILKGKKDFHNQLIIYYLQNLDLHPYITGAVQPKLSKGSLLQIPFHLPEDEFEQRAIASVLSSLDDKIDLLHRQNQTLEQMAETLFRQWFQPPQELRSAGVEEADEGWEYGILGDEFDFTMGQSPPGSSFNEDGIGTPMYQGNRDFGFRFPENRVFSTEPKRFAEKHDTLISVRAPVGEQNMANEKCCIGRGVAAFRYKANPDFFTYTFYKLKSLMDEIKQFNETGTVFGSISKKDFQEMEVIIPPAGKVERFQNEVKPLDDKIFTNSAQIRTLAALRDTLLPKLMSGEVRVEMSVTAKMEEA